MSDFDLQEFGRLQAEVSALRRDNDRLLEALLKLTTKIEGIERQLSEAKGGWKVLMVVGGASATLGGFITSLVSHFLGR